MGPAEQGFSAEDQIAAYKPDGFLLQWPLGDLPEAFAERLRVAVNRFIVDVELAQGGFGLPHRQLWQPGYAGLHGLEDGISSHLSAQIQGTGRPGRVGRSPPPSAPYAGASAGWLPHQCRPCRPASPARPPSSGRCPPGRAAVPGLHRAGLAQLFQRLACIGSACPLSCSLGWRPTQANVRPVCTR